MATRDHLEVGGAVAARDHLEVEWEERRRARKGKKAGLLQN